MIRVALAIAAMACAIYFDIAMAFELTAISPKGEVAADGTFNQRVPISVPVYHGLEPDLGIEHNTNFGNGKIGWGWRLLGEEVIERVANRTGIPRMNGDDVFQFNGNTLIPCRAQVPAGVSCTSGGTHGLEHETHKRVVKEGTNWLVWEPNGTRSLFVPLAPGGIADTRWVLSERIDTHGNRLSYRYWCDGVDECYLKEIEYGDTRDPSHRTRIQYRWEKKSDIATYAMALPRLVAVRFRLQSIVVWTNGSVRNALDVRYAQSAFGRWANASRVREIVRFGRDVEFDTAGRIRGGTQLPAERFGLESDSFEAQSLGPQLILSASSPIATTSNTSWASRASDSDVPWGPINASTLTDPIGSQQWMSMDVNGDGLSDAVGIVHDGTSNPGTVRIITQLNRGDGTFRPAVSGAASWAYWLPASYRISVGLVVLNGDFNADGLADMLAIWADSNTRDIMAQAAFGTDQGTFAMQPSFSPLGGKWADGHKWLVGDVDGDGRDDLVVVESVSVGSNSLSTVPRIHTLRSSGSSFVHLRSTDAPWTHLSSDWPYWFIGDRNGDGRADVIRVESLIANPVGRGAQIGVAQSDGRGGFNFSQFNTKIPNWSPTQSKTRLGYRPLGADLAKIGDFDGNGLTDVVLFSPLGPDATFNFDHLRATVVLSQPDGGFQLKEQDLSLGLTRQNNFNGFGSPSRWLAMDIDRDGVTDLVVVTPPDTGPTSLSWPQQTLVISLRSNRDGSFEDLGLASSRTVSVPFECPARIASNSNTCVGAPWFDVLPAELNGDAQSDLLFVRYDNYGGNVGLTVEPSPRIDRPELGWRPADISGDGRLDFVQIVATGGEIVVRSTISAGDGVGTPRQVLQTIHGVAWAGIDTSRWLIADVGSPTSGIADGKADLIYIGPDLFGRGAVPTGSLVLLSNGDGTYQSRSSTITNISLSSLAYSWRLGDFNADGRADLARVTRLSTGLRVEVAAARGDGTWVYEVQTVTGVPAELAVSRFQSTDIDGDGRQDLVVVDKSTDTSGVTIEQVVALRANEGFEFQPLIWQQAGSNVPAKNWRVADMNGDGKQDLVSVTPEQTDVMVATLLSTGGGTSWSSRSSTASPVSSVTQATLKVTDINGDGCDDMLWVYTLYSITTRGSWLVNRCDGTYHGFSHNIGTIDPWTVRWQAMEADGRTNLVAHQLSPSGDTVLNGVRREFARPLVTGVDNGIGLSQSVSYMSTAGTHAETPNGRVGLVVSQLAGRSFPLGGSVESRYRYEGARWSAKTRAFFGFRSVEVSEGNSITKSLFSQTDGCAMQPVRVEVRNAKGLFWASNNKYIDSSANINQPSAPWVCKVEESSHEECELGTACRTTFKKLRRYDLFGNIVDIQELGDPLVANDDRSIRTSYFPNVVNYIVNAPAETELLGPTGARITLTRAFYDGASLHSDPPSRGDVTRSDVWESVSNSFLRTSRGYDSVGNELFTTDAAQRTTRMEWDQTFSRFPIQRCNAKWCTKTAWDLVLGAKRREIDPSRRVIRHRYDAIGRHRRTDYPDGGCLEHQYLDWGLGQRFFLDQRTVESRCSPPSGGGVGSRSRLQYIHYFDGLQRVWREVRSGGYERKRSFDGWSARVRNEEHWRSSGALPIFATRFRYDDAHRLVATILPDGSVRSTTFQIGNSIELSPGGGRRQIARDGLGRISSVSEDVAENGQRVAAIVRYEYDALDRMIHATDPNSRITSWQPNSLGWMVGECDPDRGCRSRTFDATGHVKSEINAGRQRVEHDYDALGRPLVRRAFDAAGVQVETASWQYDSGARFPGSLFAFNANATGRVARIVSSNGASEDRTYDSMGRIRLRRSCVSGSCVFLRTDWDIVGRLEKVTYPDYAGTLSRNSESVVYRYDSAGRVNRVGGYILGATYTADDQLASIRYGNGVVQTMGYDPNRRWVEQMEIFGPAASGGGLTSISSAQYSYDADGRVLNELRRGSIFHQRVYKYDPSGRLLTVLGAQPDEFEYDLAGNILKRQSVGPYRYSDPAHPNAVTSAGSGTFVYDSTGRLVLRNGFQMNWDPLDRWVGMETVGNGTVFPVTFAYTVDGALAARITPMGMHKFHGNLMEVDASGSLEYNYVIGDSIFAQRKAGGVHFMHRDRLGSVIEITDQMGKVLEAYSYSPWGRALVARASGARTLDNDQRYAGGREHPDSELIHLGARALDPVLARFTSPDKIVPNAYRPVYLNRYVYARNNPVNITDPSGFAPPDEKNPIVDKAISRLIELLKPLRKEDISIIGELPTKAPAIPRDPLAAVISILRHSIESKFPEIQILKLPPFNSLAKGAGGSFTAGACAVFCIGNIEVDVGLYAAPPVGPNDYYFSELNPYITVGGSILSFSPGSGVDWLSPSGFADYIQMSGGLGAGLGFSGFGFLSQATTVENYQAEGRQISFSGGEGLAVGLSLSKNQAGQYTGAVGVGPSWGTPFSGQIYNTYTWTGGGVINWLKP